MRATLIGALLAGTLDLADALIFFATRGVRPIRILQSIRPKCSPVLRKLPERGP